MTQENYMKFNFSVHKQNLLKYRHAPLFTYLLSTAAFALHWLC